MQLKDRIKFQFGSIKKYCELNKLSYQRLLDCIDGKSNFIEALDRLKKHWPEDIKVLAEYYAEREASQIHPTKIDWKNLHLAYQELKEAIKEEWKTTAEFCRAHKINEYEVHNVIKSNRLAPALRKLLSDKYPDIYKKIETARGKGNA